MRELVTDGVPARIVMAGTSTMKLHERFSKLPARKIIKKVARAPPHSRASFVSARNIIPYNEIDDDLFAEYDDAVEGDIRYSKVMHRGDRNYRSRGIATRTHIPISHRLTMPPKSRFVYVNPTKRGPFNAARRGVGNQSAYERLNNNRNNRRFHRGGYNNRGVRGRPMLNNLGYSKNNNNDQKKSVDQLDRELEEYMRKGKHPRILV